MRHREFLPALGLGGPTFAAGAHALAAAQANPPPQSAAEARRRPRIGCVSWNFHSLAPGAP